MANRFYIRRNEPGARVLPVIRTEGGLCVASDIYAPLPEADALTESEARQVQNLLDCGAWLRVNHETEGES
jgi:hypothetical protein